MEKQQEEGKTDFVSQFIQNRFKIRSLIPERASRYYIIKWSKYKFIKFLK
jgi:hypothetical protein